MREPAEPELTLPTLQPLSITLRSLQAEADLVQLGDGSSAGLVLVFGLGMSAANHEGAAMAHTSRRIRRRRSHDCASGVPVKTAGKGPASNHDRGLGAGEMEEGVMEGIPRQVSRLEVVALSLHSVRRCCISFMVRVRTRILQ